jgi:hypothetical protein
MSDLASFQCGEKKCSDELDTSLLDLKDSLSLRVRVKFKKQPLNGLDGSQTVLR